MTTNEKGTVCGGAYPESPIGGVSENPCIHSLNLSKPVIQVKPVITLLNLREFTPWLLPLFGPTAKCKSPGKLFHAAISKDQRGTPAWKFHPNAYYNRPPTPVELAAWENADPPCNVGILTGEVSGYAVMERDGPPPGCFDLLPPTVTATTGRGEHYYYTCSGPTRSYGEIKLPCNGTKVQLQGDGRYAVAPGSLHPNGKRYAWSPGRGPGEIEVAPLPAEIPEVFHSDTAPLRERKKKTPAKVEQTRVHMYSCRIEGEKVLTPSLVEVLIRDLGVMRRLVEKMGVPDAGGAFSCIRPGHGPDNTPSAAVFIPPYVDRYGEAPAGEALYKCFHRDGRAVTVPQVYAEKVSGKNLDPVRKEDPETGEVKWKRQFHKVEARVWGIRALVELLGYQLPEVRLQARPLVEAPANYRKVYEGFIYLLKIRQALHPGELSAPFAYRFAALWCGVGKDTAARAIAWLKENSYLRFAGTTPNKTGVYALQPAARERTVTRREVADRRVTDREQVPDRIGAILADAGLVEVPEETTAGRGP